MCLVLTNLSYLGVCNYTNALMFFELFIDIRDFRLKKYTNSSSKIVHAET